MKKLNNFDTKMFSQRTRKNKDFDKPSFSIIMTKILTEF